MSRFDLERDDVDWTLYAVYWLQTGFLIMVGALLIAIPQRRFGGSFQFVLQTPGGKYLFGLLAIAVGVALIWALLRGNQVCMSRGLFVGGTTFGVFGLFLLTGAVFGPTGVLGSPAFFYIAGHMILQSVLLSKRRA